MSGQGAELDAEDMRGLFQELSDRLDVRGIHAQLFVVGGRQWPRPTSRTASPATWTPRVVHYRAEPNCVVTPGL